MPLAAAALGAEDAPVLVLGNSLGTTRALWEPQLPALAARFRLLCYELPGHGDATVRSASPAGRFTVADIGAGVLALLDFLQIRQARYCGVSVGGMVGMWLAAHAPDRIERLAVCCTSAHLPPAAGWYERAKQVRSAGPGSITDQSAGRWFTAAFRAARPEVERAFAADLAATDAAGYAGCCEAIAGMDLRAELARIAAPTLVIAGAEDPSTPPWHGAVIARGVPGARLAVVRGAAHLANVSAAGEVTSLLLGHLG
jgi:3-oxoadipate enol-lactonase